LLYAQNHCKNEDKARDVSNKSQRLLSFFPLKIIPQKVK
jgi:hypothetical protein